jgi:malate dehydrogenase (oxaloacetate-decarboxylating)(NADP+)
MSIKEEALQYHQQGRPGKIEVTATKPLSTQRHLSLAYTPGVAEPCRAIHSNPEDVYKYTAKGNLVAVITNGTAVLGLGDIGPEASKPVMEGKANLFKKFADIDVFDIELNAKTADELVAVITAMAPTFGGINLEDIKAPECFEVERRLQETLDIPIFHDDQHGTAMISAAALINAVELTKRNMAEVKLVINGAGAAAIACAELYISLGLQRNNIIMFDSRGAITTKRENLPPSKAAFATEREVNDLREALQDADAFIGLSVGNVLSGDDIQGMSKNPIIFAMANPDPEIPYHEAKEARPDAVLATGRSDYPNQVNNVLGFPFVFRGTLDCRARRITQEMKVAGTRALAELAREDVPDDVLGAYGLSHLKFGPDYIIPKPFDARVLTRVAPAVARAAEESGVAREPIQDYEAYRESLHQIVERARGIMRPLLRRAKNSKRKMRIVLPDGRNRQMLRAAQVLVDEGICTPILIGRREGILERAREVDVDIEQMEVEEILPSERFDTLAKALWDLRGRRGMTHSLARMNLRSSTWYGAMMVREGLADGMVGGLGRPYKHTVRPALQVLGLEEGCGLVSGAYAMLFKDRKLFFGDCTVNIAPNAEQLAEIAINTARIAETFGERPRVALLSYSDFGEHYHDDRVDTVRNAVDIIRKRCPDLQVDGEMQADTAVNWGKMKNDFPLCTLSGPANVLIFPDLTSGNIAYKLLQNLTDAEALGPLLVGMGGPVSVVPVSAGVNEIINITTYTVVQALERQSALD